MSDDGQEVTDNQTNLIWRRCSEGMNWDGLTCTGSATTFSHEAALQHASAQAISTGFAWRLPNIKELSSILDRNFGTPAIDPTIFPATPASIFYLFWSSSPLVYFPSYALAVNFGDSGIIAYHRANTDYVRLVRDNQ
jgi:hypothetical protein